MQSEMSPGRIPESVLGTLTLNPRPEAPLTEHEMAELHEAWLEHQVNPLGVIQSRGMPCYAMKN